jgi:arylsulfatase A-like enzyme
LRDNLREVDPVGHATDVFTEWAIAYLNERKETPQPFFLYLAYNAPHMPIQPPEEWLEKVRRRAPKLSPTRARLVALIEHLDHGIGQVLDTLRANGQASRTLIVFTSDNGGQLIAGATCGGLRGGKEDLYEGGIRVPACVVWPGRVGPGIRTDRVALTMDLLPTLCEAAGVSVTHPIDGQSLMPTLRGQPAAAEVRDLFWTRREGGPRYQGRDYFAVRRGDWKLVQNHPFEPYRLYHLGQDPLEQHDRAAMERTVYADLVRALMKHVQQAGAVPWQAERRTEEGPRAKNQGPRAKS